MPSFPDYFSEERVIEELCRARVKLAGKRHDAAFLHNIARTATSAHATGPLDWGDIPLDIFPSRRVWHRFRPKRRGSMQAQDLNFRALYTAVLALRHQAPQPAWARKLHQTLQRIRQRVLSDQPFHLKPPVIIPLAKERGGHVYRPLATYPLEAKIIEGLTARYLRTLLDNALLPSCMAFRCGKKRRPPPSTHDALAAILALQARHTGRRLFVAECDIKGFFDCVGHRSAREAVDRLISDATVRDPSLHVHPRALEIFDAYLQSYSFLRNVRGKAQRALHKRDSQGVFKWHEQDLQRLYKRTALPSIGVPQGGALSCLIANAVLHEADKKLASLQKVGKSFLYLRYCDDMIIIAPDRASCSAAYLAYLRILQSLRLPAHPSHHVTIYTKDFWDGKSNAPYEWSSTGIPWIQFVGYQIRHDGLVRIRPKSIKKQRKTITEATDRLLAALRRGNRQKSIRRSAREIQHRLRQKLISMSVGRITLGKQYTGPRPMSWAAGFRGLQGHPICHNHLKQLDRHRERQTQRLKRYLGALHLPQSQVLRKGTKAHKYYGRPFSYWRQFL